MQLNHRKYGVRILVLTFSFNLHVSHVLTFFNDLVWWNKDCWQSQSRFLTHQQKRNARIALEVLLMSGNALALGGVFYAPCYITRCILIWWCKIDMLSSLGGMFFLHQPHVRVSLLFNEYCTVYLGLIKKHNQDVI